MERRQAIQARLTIEVGLLRERLVPILRGLSRTLSELETLVGSPSTTLRCSHSYEHMVTSLQQSVDGGEDIRAILRDHTVQYILDVGDAMEARASYELHIAQMKARRALVQLLRNADETPIGVPTSVAHWSIVQCDVDEAILQAQDETITAALNHPAALFPLHSNHDCRTETYSLAMNHAKSWNYEKAVLLVQCYRLVAFGLLEALGLQGFTMEHILALGKTFRCDSCPSGVGPLYGWINLVRPENHVFPPGLISSVQVRHHVQERRWYGAHYRELEEIRKTRNCGPAPWVNTHGSARASLLATGEAHQWARRDAQAAEATNTSPKYVCMYCPHPPAGHSPSDPDAVQLASVPMGGRIAIQHMLERWDVDSLVTKH